MQVGIGLPNTITDVTGEQMTEWARRADAAGFSSLGTIDRLVYPNCESLIALATAAAVTERIRLRTTVLLKPLRKSAPLLAHQGATLQRLSGGRFDLGAAVGGREDDFEAAGVPMSERGRRFDEMLEEIASIWHRTASGPANRIGPDVDDNPPKIIIGGSVDVSFRRAAQHDGWIMGGGTPAMFADGKAKLLEAWGEAGREGEPYAGALAYFSLGPDAQRNAEHQVGGYYEWLGEYRDAIVGGVAKDEGTVKAYLQAFSEAGCDELVLFPASADPEQVDLLAGAAL